LESNNSFDPIQFFLTQRIFSISDPYLPVAFTNFMRTLFTRTVSELELVFPHFLPAVDARKAEPFLWGSGESENAC
jgi:hypothetical protein